MRTLNPHKTFTVNFLSSHCALISCNNCIQIFDANTGECIKKLDYKVERKCIECGKLMLDFVSTFIECTKIALDGSLFCGYTDGKVRQWNLEMETCIQLFESHTKTVNDSILLNF